MRRVVRHELQIFLICWNCIVCVRHSVWSRETTHRRSRDMTTTVIRFRHLLPKVQKSKKSLGTRYTSLKTLPTMIWCAKDFFFWNLVRSRFTETLTLSCQFDHCSNDTIIYVKTVETCPPGTVADNNQTLCIFPGLFHQGSTSMLASLIHFNQSDHVKLQEDAHKL